MSSKVTCHGDNLRLARLVSGLTLQELGERIGNKRQYISKLESNDNQIAIDLANALAYELNVNINFFSSETGNQVKEEECHFRKLKSTLVSTKRECAARATMLNKLITELDIFLDLPKINFPSYSCSSLTEVESAAQNCRKHWGLGEGPILSVSRILENVGAVISNLGDISEKVDALSIHRERPIILLNPTKSAPRLRMDLAHEAAHIVLHEGIETGDRETESQADYFASTFLLPRKALLAEYGHKQKSRLNWDLIRDIKIKWGVSTRAIIFRLNQMQIITPSQYRTANIHLSKTGQSKSEWYDENISIESPEILGNSLKLLINTYGKDFGGLLNNLGINSDFLLELTQTKEVIGKLLEEEDLPENITSLNAYRNLKQNSA